MASCIDEPQDLLVRVVEWLMAMELPRDKFWGRNLGAGFDGALYDESRRKKVLSKPTPEVLAKAQKPLGEWNEYRIRAEGPRIQIWLNGVQTVDYTETEPGIDTTGIIAVQIHGNATSIVRYKELMIEELPAKK